MQVKDKPISLDFEFLDIAPLNEYISECEIRVFYHGKNRNGSYISKPVANEIAKSLPMAPIVAFYNEEVEDYEDHGEEIVINKQGIDFITKTVPYGMVAEYPNARWETIEHEDGEEKEYLVVNGYLWTGRYPHLKKVLEDSKGQSMEFFEESVEGNWAKFDNEDSEFFIFNEADISALCILGDDVEPCFEESIIGAPSRKQNNSAVMYSLEKNEFQKNFNEFVSELGQVLNYNKKEGGTELKDEKDVTIEEEEIEEEVETPEDVEEEVVDETGEEDSTDEDEEVEDEFKKEDDKKKKKDEDKDSDEDKDEDDEDEDDKKKKKNHSKDDLAESFAQLQKQFDALESKYDDLVAHTTAKENEEKENLCEKFSALGEDIISEVKEDLDKFTVDELEKELSALAFKEGITFDLIDNKNTVITHEPNKKVKQLPAWLEAVRKQKEEE